MKYFLIILCVIFSFSTFTECQTSNIKITSYNIEASYLRSYKSIDIELVCSFQIKDHADSVLFVFNDKCKINSIKFEKDTGWDDLRYHSTGKDSLSVELSKGVEPNKIQRLKFEYSFPAGEYNDTVFITDRGERWYPLIMDQVASFRLTCKVSNGMKVLSAGNLIGEKTEGDTVLFMWESELPVFKLPLIVFNPLKFEKSNIKAGETAISLYTFPEDTAGTSSLLIQAAGAVDYFNSLLGQYPYKNITLIEVNDFNGVNIGSGLLMVGAESLNGIRKGYYNFLLMPLAAEWFGAGVFAKYIEPGFFFLNISLPHYLRLMYIRHSEGEKAFEKSLLKSLENYKKFAGKENDIPVIDIDYPNTREKGLILYAKGPYILSRVEKELGSSAWKDFIYNLYNLYCGKILTYQNFKEMLSHYDKDGKTVRNFDKMMSEKGLPQ
jgi:hypothetical protein